MYDHHHLAASLLAASLLPPPTPRPRLDLAACPSPPTRDPPLAGWATTTDDGQRPSGGTDSVHDEWRARSIARTTHGEDDARRRDPLPSNEGCGPAIFLDTADSQGPPLTVTEPPACLLPPATLLPPSTLPTIPPSTSTVDAHGGRPPSTNCGQRAWRAASEHKPRSASTTDGQNAASEHRGRRMGPYGEQRREGVGLGGEQGERVERARTTASNADGEPGPWPATPIVSDDDASRADNQRAEQTPSEQSGRAASRADGRQPASTTDGQLAERTAGQRARITASEQNARPASEDGQQPARTTSSDLWRPRRTGWRGRWTVGATDGEGGSHARGAARTSECRSAYLYPPVYVI
ncbi:hypothetical protein BJ912DRAFT_1041034 [Pholiota molesta]|nr:hypothetical protein BJ912DRAFT_1041034 [Pholiota molesta]